MSSTVEHGARSTTCADGLWIAGEEHVVYWLAGTAAPGRQRAALGGDGVTYRLEGKTLTKERALELAREIGRRLSPVGGGARPPTDRSAFARGRRRPLSPGWHRHVTDSPIGSIA